jgi:hypothetical protein
VGAIQRTDPFALSWIQTSKADTGFAGGNSDTHVRLSKIIRPLQVPGTV